MDRWRQAPRLQGRLRDHRHRRLHVRLRGHDRRGADHHFDLAFEAFWSRTRRPAISSAPTTGGADEADIAKIRRSRRRGLWPRAQFGAYACILEAAHWHPSPRRSLKGEGAHDRRNRTKKTDLMTEAERDAYHAEKMKKKKEAREQDPRHQDRGEGPAHRPHRQGQGQVDRRLRHGVPRHRPRFPVGIVQFVKGAWSTGERDVLENSPISSPSTPWARASPGTTQDRQRDLAAARAAWESAKAC
jgi:hypothetical protein